MTQMKYTIDCAQVMTFADFIEALNEGFVRSVGGEWNGNLDALNDYLFWPEVLPYTLELLGASQCRAALGYQATVQWLECLLTTCHPSNQSRIKIRLREAKASIGATLWDEIEQIFESKQWLKVVY
uniref:hypothetical protein n=1 Tax=Thaumasiovibrio occultus TaxID=1891184 RepID=UPI00131BA8B2|nr:hypothetical protein [Thaumasiovibrio occultus]